MSAELVDDLARARAAFDSWRAGRSGAGRIPEHLWAIAESRLPERFTFIAAGSVFGAIVRFRGLRTHPNRALSSLAYRRLTRNGSAMPLR
jgi:hypothetical protein